MEYNSVTVFFLLGNTSPFGFSLLESAAWLEISGGNSYPHLADFSALIPVSAGQATGAAPVSTACSARDFRQWLGGLNPALESLQGIKWLLCFSFVYHFVMANTDGFISNSRAAHWGRRQRDQFHWLGPFIALWCKCVQSINGFIGEHCCELRTWRNKAQVGQITCPRTYKKLGSRSQISRDLYGASLAYFELRCFAFGIPLSLLLCLDPLEAINNPLKSPISCQICRSVGQDALRGRPFIQVVMSADSFFWVCLFPKDIVLLTFKMS